MRTRRRRRSVARGRRSLFEAAGECFTAKVSGGVSRARRLAGKRMVRTRPDRPPPPPPAPRTSDGAASALRVLTPRGLWAQIDTVARLARLARASRSLVEFVGTALAHVPDAHKLEQGQHDPEAGPTLRNSSSDTRSLREVLLAPPSY